MPSACELILDTLAWVWAVAGETRRIGPRTRRLLNASARAGRLRVSPISAWEEFLSQCRANPSLDPKAGPCPAMISRPTGLVIDPDPSGGVHMQLLEFGEHGSTVLAEGRVGPQAAH